MSKQTEILWGEEVASVATEEWQEYLLGNLGKVVTGNTPSKDNPGEWGELMLFVTPSDYRNYRKKAFESVRMLSETGVNRFAKKVLPPNSILVTCIGSDMGKVVMNEVAAVTNQQINSLIPDTDLVDNDFLYYNLVGLYDTLVTLGSDGTAVPILNKSDFENISTQIPALPEQRAIADVLSSLDDKIDLLHRQNATLEALAETLFRQWFVEEAKEEWETTTLGQHTEVFRGLSYKGSGLAESGFGVPMHNLNSILEGGGYKYVGIKFYNGDYKPRHQILPGDIIVSNTEQGHEFRLIGFPAIVTDSFGELGLFSQHLYKLVPLPESFLSREFLYYLLQSSSVREQVISATNGSTVNMLAIDGLQRPEFKLPPKGKVDDFTSTVSNYWQKKKINQTQIQTLSTLRDTLLPKLMSGAVRVAY